MNRMNFSSTGAASRLRSKTIVLTGMMAAILAVLSQISIPLPIGVPITMQTFAVALAGFTLGIWQGSASVLVYLLLGLIGVPVFAGFSGGPGSFVSLAGGFLYGFLPMAFFCGLGSRSQKPFLVFLLAMIGLACCHLFGVLQFAILSGHSLLLAFLQVSVPYLVKDILSVIAAFPVSLAIQKGIRASA